MKFVNDPKLFLLLRILSSDHCLSICSFTKFMGSLTDSGEGFGVASCEFYKRFCLVSSPWNSERSWYYAAGTGIKVAIKPIYRVASPVRLFTSSPLGDAISYVIMVLVNQFQCFLDTDSSS